MLQYDAHCRALPGDVVSGTFAGVDFIGRVHNFTPTRSRWTSKRGTWYAIHLDGPLFDAKGRLRTSGGFAGHDHVLHLSNPELTIVQRCELPIANTGGGWVASKEAA